MLDLFSNVQIVVCIFHLVLQLAKSESLRQQRNCSNEL